MNEVWKDIAGYEGIYQVSNLGRVRSLDRTYYLKNGRTQSAKGRIMAFYDTKDGYKGVKLRTTKSRVSFRVHRLVAEAFIANPFNYPCINHKDENKQNNVVENLEWCTQKYNMNFGTLHHRLSVTHKNHPILSKSIEQYSLDGRFIQSYPSAAEASRQTGIHRVNIRACCRGLYTQSGGYIWKEIKTL